MRRSVIIGCGGYLPEKIMTNADLARLVETSDEWIVERTGIRERHIAAKGQLTSDLAVEAAKAAISRAGIAAQSIDLIVLATTTPDDTMPSTATKVQHRLGIAGGGAFDLNAACSGFVYALTVADSLLRIGTAKRALVIGAETYSRIIDWEDRGTCILFGDGAGAIVLEAQEGAGTVLDRGILYSAIGADGQYGPILATTGGVSSTQAAGKLTMAGKEVFRHAVAKMAESVEKGLEALNLPLSALNWLIPHQANIRILQATGKRLNLPEDKVMVTVDRHANTSAASIPLAMDVAVKEGRFASGQLLALPALGAGLTWGCSLIRW